jgi:hypothetical protein
LANWITFGVFTIDALMSASICNAHTIGVSSYVKHTKQRKWNCEAQSAQHWCRVVHGTSVIIFRTLQLHYNIVVTHFANIL